MFHPERLNDPAKLKRMHSIFVCSMADLFGKWVPQDWIDEVLYAAARTTGQVFIFLTKDPANMVEKVDDWRDTRGLNEAKSQLWFGTTITCENDAHRLDELKQMPTRNLFVSFEPLLDNLGRAEIDPNGIKGYIIGAQTAPTIAPDPYVVESLVVDIINAGGTAFLKDSLVDTESWSRCLATVGNGRELRSTPWIQPEKS